MTESQKISLVAYARLSSYFGQDGVVISATKIFDYLKLIVKQSATDGKRFVVRYQNPKQRIAFSDYVDELTVVTATTRCQITTKTTKPDPDSQTGIVVQTHYKLDAM